MQNIQVKEELQFYCKLSLWGKFHKCISFYFVFTVVGIDIIFNLLRVFKKLSLLLHPWKRGWGGVVVFFFQLVAQLILV